MCNVNNEDFCLYIYKYCKNHKIAVTEALEHRTVQNVREYYRERTKTEE